MATSTLEKKRNELGFHPVGHANGMRIYISAERSNALESKKRVIEAKLDLATYQLLLSGFGSENSLKEEFTDSGKCDYSFWIAGIGKDTNHLIDKSQESEITLDQEAEAMKLAESGMNYKDIAKKLEVTALSVYYALKKKGKTKAKMSIKPRSSALCTFDKKGNLRVGKGDSLETTVRVSRGLEDEPLLFFVLRDSYSRIGGARFVIAACNGRQFTAATLAGIIVGVTPEA